MSLMGHNDLTLSEHLIYLSDFCSSCWPSFYPFLKCFYLIFCFCSIWKQLPLLLFRLFCFFAYFCYLLLGIAHPNLSTSLVRCLLFQVICVIWQHTSLMGHNDLALSEHLIYLSDFWSSCWPSLYSFLKCFYLIFVLICVIHWIIRQSQKYKIPKDIRIKGRSGFKKNKKQKTKIR
jgi:hypothetical protein